LNLNLDLVANYSFTDKQYYRVFNYDSDNSGVALVNGTELYKYLSAKVQLLTNIGNVTINDDGSGQGGEGGEGGEGGPDTPVEPFKIVETKNSETSLEISFTKEITFIDYDELGLQLATDISNLSYRTMVRGVDYRVVSGVGSNLFIIELDNVGRTFMIKFDMPSGAIRHGNELAPALSTQFGYNNGVPV
jgi:hypothetical protein